MDIAHLTTISHGTFEINNLPKLLRDEDACQNTATQINGIVTDIHIGKQKVIIGESKLQSSFPNLQTFHLSLHCLRLHLRRIRETYGPPFKVWMDQIAYSTTYAPLSNVLKYAANYFRTRKRDPPLQLGLGSTTTWRPFISVTRISLGLYWTQPPHPPSKATNPQTETHHMVVKPPETTDKSVALTRKTPPHVTFKPAKTTRADATRKNTVGDPTFAIHVVGTVTPPPSVPLNPRHSRTTEYPRRKSRRTRCYPSWFPIWLIPPFCLTHLQNHFSPKVHNQTLWHESSFSPSHPRSGKPFSFCNAGKHPSFSCFGKHSSLSCFNKPPPCSGRLSFLSCFGRPPSLYYSGKHSGSCPNRTTYHPCPSRYGATLSIVYPSTLSDTRLWQHRACPQNTVSPTWVSRSGVPRNTGWHRTVRCKSRVYSNGRTHVAAKSPLHSQSHGGDRYVHRRGNLRRASPRDYR